MKRNCARIGFVAAVVFLAGCVLLTGAKARAAEVAYDAEAVLSGNDLGGAGDKVQVGRWSKPATDGDRSVRTYPGNGSLSRVGIKAWWKQGEWAPKDVALIVTFKDTLTAPVRVYGWTGIGGLYGYPAIGQLSGVNDGQWKKGLLIASKGGIRRSAAGDWSVMFVGGPRMAIDRIEVVTLTEGLRAESIRRARAARAAHIEARKKVLRKLPPKKEGELGTVSAADRQRGFIPYVRNYTRDIFPLTIPEAAERGVKALRARATPGEYEPIQVAVYALKDLTVSARLSDLTGPATLKAGADAVIRRVECVAVRAGGGSSARNWQVHPVWLRENEPAAAMANTSQAWYITVHVPEGAAAGIYKGALTLSAKSGGKAEFPVEFKVLPFRLDKADHVARGPYVSGIISPEFVKDLAEHGCNSSSMWANAGLKPVLKGDKCVAAVSDAMNKYLQALKKAGFVKMVYFGGGDPRYGNPGHVVSATKARVGTPEFEKYYGQYWTDIRRLEKENGWPEMICCPFDEPVKSPAKVRNYLACYNAVKKVSPETKVFCVFMNRGWACTKLGKQADIWSCNGAFATNAAQKKKLAAEGIRKQFWPYTMCTARIRPGSCRWSSGFGPWKYTADGIYFWAYLWHNQDPFNDLDGGYSDWTPAARDVDGKVYSCVGWEGWREGIDDRLYVETAIRMAKEMGRKDVLAKIAALQTGIVKGTEADHSVRTKGLDGFFMKIANPSLLDIYRAQVVAMIMDMRGGK